MADHATQNPELYELNNGAMQVFITNLGCAISSLSVPGKDGKLADVVLGFDSLEPYLTGYHPVDQSTVPTGEITPIKATSFDFTSSKRIGSSIHKVGLGCGHNYVLDFGDEEWHLKLAAKVKDPLSCRVLNLWTTAPGIQFYTANYVNGVKVKEVLSTESMEDFAWRHKDFLTQ